MLMEAKGKKGVLMTADGRFIQVRLPNNSVALGEEISAPIWQHNNWFKHSFIAAAVLLMFLLPGYHLFSKQAIAYVALDINPSIELAVDKNTNIIKAQGLNEDGVKIISQAQVTGMNLYQGLPLIVQQAIKDGYLAKEQENVVLSTITLVKNQPTTAPISKHKVEVAINEPMQRAQNISANVIMEQSDMEKRGNAQKMGLSTGKYILYQTAQQQGCKVTIEDAKNQSVQQLISQLPPGQLKKVNSTKQLPPGQVKKILDINSVEQHEKTGQHKVEYLNQTNDKKNNKEDKNKKDKDKQDKDKKDKDKQDKDKQDKDKKDKDEKDKNKKEKDKKLPPGQLKKQQQTSDE